LRPFWQALYVFIFYFIFFLARKLEITGDVTEVFEFPNFSTVEEKETLLTTVRQFLTSCINEIIVNHHENLEPIALSQLSSKVVNQVLISLCQVTF